jgi:hypothetical protein
MRRNLIISKSVGWVLSLTSIPQGTSDMTILHTFRSLGMVNARQGFYIDCLPASYGGPGTHRYPQGLLELVVERRTPLTWTYHFSPPSSRSETNHCKAGAGTCDWWLGRDMPSYQPIIQGIRKVVYQRGFKLTIATTLRKPPPRTYSFNIYLGDSPGYTALSLAPAAWNALLHSIGPVPVIHNRLSPSTTFFL